MSLSAGTRLGAYKIIAPLGVGGMGEVYLAQDPRLDRRLALKLLPAKFTTDEIRVRRFEQEARAASALNHPNIITIHDIGEAEGRHFIATEFVEGETLRRRMRQRLSIREAIETAVQIASALSAAHGAGIIHRDIKPENVMLRPDGLVKVLDFGLAKLAPPKLQQVDSGAATLHFVNTDSGAVVGTVAYMSPEQARGVKVDARTDIFSFGVALYEMVAGRQPFEGQTAPDLIASILKTEPLPLSNSAPDAPAELQRIVSKALRKDRSMRYQSIDDLLVDLTDLKREMEFKAQLEMAAPGAPERTADRSDAAFLETASLNQRPTARVKSRAESAVIVLKRNKLVTVATLLVALGAALGLGLYLQSRSAEVIDSIAVLPFTGLENDHDAEYLTDGITEQLINSLSQLPRLRVPARATMFGFKGKDPDPQGVGRQLHVRAVLMGRVQRRERDLRLQVDLVGVAKGLQLWGKQYNRKLSEIQSVQEEIVRDISGRLALGLTGEQIQKVVKRSTQNSDAYDLYLQGRYELEKRSEEGIKRAIEFFRRAIDDDGDFALAYSGLADCYILGGNALPVPETQVRRLAKEAAKNALARDDTLAEAHASMAVVGMLYEWDWSSAESEFKRAIELNPNYPAAHRWYAEYLSATGRHEEAFSEIARAQELDQFSVSINRDVGVHYYYAGQYDKAIAQALQTLDLDRNFAPAHTLLGLSYLKKSRFQEAISELREVAAHSTSARDKAMLAQAYALDRNPTEARRLLAELQRERVVSPYYIAVVYAGLGEQQSAIDSLETAFREQVSSLVYLNVDPRLESLRGNDKFGEMVSRLRLPK